MAEGRGGTDIIPGGDKRGCSFSPLALLPLSLFLACNFEHVFRPGEYFRFLQKKIASGLAESKVTFKKDLYLTVVAFEWRMAGEREETCPYNNFAFVTYTVFQG